MTRVPHPNARGAAPRALAAGLAASTFLLVTLSSCIAPARAPEKPSAPRTPWEDMRASIAMGRPEEALVNYEKSLAVQPESTETRILHGRLLMIAGKLADAREEFNLVLAGEPRNTTALYNLAVVAGLEGNGEEREGLLRRVVDIDPLHGEGLAALGDVMRDRGDTAAAGGLYERALAVNPDTLTALLGSGALRVSAGEWESAAAFFTRAILSQPDYPFAYADRAKARVGLADMRGALDDLSRAIALDPGYAWSYADRGRVYRQLSRPVEAEADFSMAIRLDASPFQLYVLRAETREQTGDLDGAVADWDMVTTLEPGYGPAYAPRAELAWAKGDWESARKAFLRAYDFNEYELSYLLCAGLCAVREGKDAGAIVQPVLALAPVDSWYHDVARFLADRDAEGVLLARIDKERATALKARMLLYAGVEALAGGMDRVGLLYLLQAEGRGAPDAVETGLVRAELTRLNALPKG